MGGAVIVPGWSNALYTQDRIRLRRRYHLGHRRVKSLDHTGSIPCNRELRHRLNPAVPAHAPPSLRCHRFNVASSIPLSD